MTDEHDTLRQAIEERLARPLPARVQQEAELCVASDELGASLVQLRTVLVAAQEHVYEAATASLEPALVLQWATDVNDLAARIGHAERHGNDLIQAVRRLLNV